MEVVRSFLKDLRGWWKDKFLKKTGSLSIEEKVWPKFLALSSVTNPKGQFIRIQKVFWQLVWSLQDHCYNTYEVVGNNFFFKMAQSFHWRKDFDLFFFQFYRLRQTLWDYIKESTKYFKNSRRIFMIICVTPKGLLKTNQLKKKGNLSSEKVFWLSLLVLSSMTDIREQLIGVHKVFWQVLCNLYGQFFRTWIDENQIFQNKVYRPEELDFV